MSDLMLTNAHLVGTWDTDKTLVAGRRMAVLPQIANGWMWVENDRIRAVGEMARMPDAAEHVTILDLEGRTVLPGWCDPHTHTVFAASREGEFVDRIQGLSYQEIAAKGGGILNSARRLRAAAEDDLYLSAKARLKEMMHLGTVAVEIKSGYGLDRASELKMLRVIQRLKADLPLQIKATLLAAHAIPEEFKQDRGGYLKLICEELIPEVAEQKLADYVDVFCETNYFTVEEMVQVIEAGKRHGLPAKLHVNQFTSIGAVPVAVELGALSVDHLEVLEDADLDALMGQECTIPTLLPSCSFFLGIPYAPARRLMDANVPVALATDHNPGSTPSGNMNFVLSLGCIQMRMLPEEAITACTLNAASAMRLSLELGSLSAGKRASFIVTKHLPSLAYLPYAFGSDLIDSVYIDGRTVRGGS